jgi:hypothetical protein
MDGSGRVLRLCSLSYRWHLLVSSINRTETVSISELRRYFIQDLFQWTDERGLPQQASGRPVLPGVDAPHLD